MQGGQIVPVTKNTINWLRKLVTVAAFGMLSAFILWFSVRPFPEWERKSLKISDESATATVSREEISQTFYAPAGIRGISILVSDHHQETGGSWLFTLYNEMNEPVDHAILRGRNVHYHEYADVVFQEAHAAGSYRVGALRGPDASGMLSIFESLEDMYKDGASFDEQMEKKDTDWCFQLLIPFPKSMLVRHRIFRTAGIAAAVVILLWGLAYGFERKKLLADAFMKRLICFFRRWQTALFVLLIFLLPTILLADFLTGDRYHIFTMLDRGADSGAQTYPTLLMLARRLDAGRVGSYFNFLKGLGVRENAFFPTLTNWVALFGEKAIAWLMGASQWMKVALSGLLAFLFAREFGTGNTFAFVAAIGYEFNSMVIDRSAWESYPNLSLLVILWLYVYERSRNRKRYVLFGAVTLVFFSGVVLFDCVFYGMLLVGYLLLRNLLLDAVPIDKKRIRRLAAEIGIFLAFCLLGSFDTFRTGLAQTLSSNRMSSGISQYSALKANEVWSDIRVWVTAFLRTIGHSIGGISEGTGSHNLLEGPAFYCGILCILLLPLSVLMVKGKKRAGYLICLAAALFYIAFIPFRILASGFAKDTFKLSSFWITLVMFLLLLELFCSLHRGERPGKRSRAVLLQMLLLCVLAYCAQKGGYVIDEDALICSLFMIVFFSMVALLHAILGRKTALFLLCAGVCVEGLTVTNNIIQDRFTYSAWEMKYSGYQDGTAEIVRELKAEDNSWFRIDKQFDSEYLADSLAQDYYGVKSYVGGTEIDGSVLAIYDAYDLPRDGDHFLQGSGSNIAFSASAGVKYFLSRDGMIPKYGCRFLRTENQINIFENELSLPLFYVTEDDQIPTIETEWIREKGSPVPYERDEKDDREVSFGERIQDKAVLLDMRFSEEGPAAVYLKESNGEVVDIPFTTKERTGLVIYMDDVQSVKLSISAVRRLEGMDIYSIDPMLCYEAFEERIREEQDSAAGIQVLGENRFTGTVSAAAPSVLATAIPYDTGWTVRIDGETCETRPVRGGFLGTEVDAGDHTVEIFYHERSWLREDLARVLGLLLLVLWACLPRVGAEKLRFAAKRDSSAKKKAEARI